MNPILYRLILLVVFFLPASCAPAPKRAPTPTATERPQVTYASQVTLAPKKPTESQPTEVSTPIPTLTKMPLPSITWTPLPTPTSDLEGLLPSAEQLCSDAYGQSLENDFVSLAKMPALGLMLLNAEGDGNWTRMESLPFVLASSAAEVQSLICIREYKYSIGFYDDGTTPAYRKNWDVSLVRMSDGVNLGGTYLNGGDPPGVTYPGIPGVGTPPHTKFMAWLVEEMEFPFPIFVPEDGSSVQRAVFSPAGDKLLTYSTQDWLTQGELTDFLKTWDLTTGEELSSAELGNLGAVVFSKNAEKLYTYETHKVISYDIATGRFTDFLENTGEIFNLGGLAIAPDSKLLAVVEPGGILLLDTSTGEIVRRISTRQNMVGLAFSPDGLTLASADDSVELWDVALGAKVGILAGHTRDAPALAFSPDGSILASGSDDATIMIWEAATGRLISTLTSQQVEVKQLAFSPDGKILASVGLNYDYAAEIGYGDDIVLWDALTWQKLFVLDGHNSISDVFFSPDGLTLASVGDGFVRFWDMALLP